MLRFSELLKRLAAAIALLSPVDTNAVRVAFRAAADELEKARQTPNGPSAVFDFHKFATAFPPDLQPYAGEFRKACADEVTMRPAPWAAKFLADAITNFVPVLLTPLEKVGKGDDAEASGTKATKAAKTANA